MKVLSKSKYLLGLQCHKYLWTVFHEPEKIPEPDKASQQKFEEGTKVGEFAKKLFPDGINIPEDFKENLKLTKELLKKRKPLFEAGFLTKNIFSRADILKPAPKNKWDIIEVKSATKVKDVNIHDVSFQKHVYEKAGLKIRKCFLMHINKEYIKKGEIKPKKLFILEDITSKVDEFIKEIDKRIKDMFKVIKLRKCPEIKIGKHCKDPYDCPLVECWKFLPDHNVFNLYRIGKKSFELVEDGILDIKDVPDDYPLNTHQKIQHDCEKTCKPYVDKNKIKSFFNGLEYPLYYMDFETFSTAIPIYDNTKPYQAVPFQFSLHVVKSKNCKPKHYSFLAKNAADPRLKFLEALKKVLGKKGSIIVYSQGFEKNILKKLSVVFPMYEKWVESVLDRVIDLLIPFRNFYYYNPMQHGSASLKNVLPVLTNKSYEGMDIDNGTDASLSFMEIIFDGVSKDKIKKVREDLLEYCGLDTEGMVWIVEKLGKLIK